MSVTVTSPHNAGILCAMVFGVMLSGCQNPNISLEPPLLDARQNRSASNQDRPAPDGAAAERESLRAVDGPNPPPVLKDKFMLADERPDVAGEPISVNFENIALTDFINTVFGELLNLSFEIDDAVVKRKQMVTLRTNEPMERNAFLDMVTEVLKSYDIELVYTDHLVHVIPAAEASKAIPRVMRGYSGGNLPAGVRPVFLHLNISSVNVANINLWMQMAFDTKRIQMVPLAQSNSLLLLGRAEDVEAAYEAIKVLDQPHFAGVRSLKIEPAFWGATRLADKLSEVLAAEGYHVSTRGNTPAGITFIPVDPLNVILVFSDNRANLRHVLDWANDLDKPTQSGSTRNVFYHPVQNTSAKDLAEVLENFLTEPSPRGSTVDQTQQTSSTVSSADQTSRLVVDEARNALIFRGTAEEYSQFRSLVQQMDRAPLEVLIEATLAEVTLDEEEGYGIEWLYEGIDSGDYTIDTGTVGGLGIGGSGATVRVFRNSINFQAVLNASKGSERISILSTPRIVTKSGSSAIINVGTQVPVVTSQQTNRDGQIEDGILQQVQYQNTGVILEVTPTINSRDYVDLIIRQEVSEAQANNTSDISSPLILQRNLETELSLQDGETVLLGGLISENRSRSENKVPLLGDIPILGNAFKTQSFSNTRTELIVLITPYVLSSNEDTRAVRDAFKARLGDWARNGWDSE